MDFLSFAQDFITPTLTCLIGWFLGGKRKANAESLGVEIDNMTAVIEQMEALNQRVIKELDRVTQEFENHLKVCNGTKSH